MKPPRLVDEGDRATLHVTVPGPSVLGYVTNRPGRFVPPKGTALRVEHRYKLARAIRSMGVQAMGINLELDYPAELVLVELPLDVPVEVEPSGPLWMAGPL